MSFGNIPTPIFNRKKPRQALLAHPNNIGSTNTIPRNAYNVSNNANNTSKSFGNNPVNPHCQGAQSNTRFQQRAQAPNTIHHQGHQYPQQSFDQKLNTRFQKRAPAPNPTHHQGQIPQQSFDAQLSTTRFQQRTQAPNTTHHQGQFLQQSFGPRCNPPSVMTPGHRPLLNITNQPGNSNCTTRPPTSQWNPSQKRASAQATGYPVASKVRAGSQPPAYSPSKASHAWGSPAQPTDVNQYNYGGQTSSTSLFYDDFNYNQPEQSPTMFQPPQNNTQSQHLRQPIQQNRAPVPQQNRPSTQFAQGEQSTQLVTKPTATTSDKFKIQTRSAKSSSDISMKLLATTVQGIKQWSKYKDNIQLLFEVLGTLHSAVTTNSDGKAKQCAIKDETGQMSAIFYEIDRNIPRLIRGQIYRFVGRADGDGNQLHCMSIRPAATAEIQLHLSGVNASDASMREWLAKNT